MKFFKIIVWNLIILFCLFLLFDLACLFKYRHEYKPLIKAQLKANPNWDGHIFNITYTKPAYIDYKEFAYKYPGTLKKRPVLTLGCSYTEGVGLEKNQTFAAKLNKYTGRTVYNGGIGGSGPQMVYRILSDEDLKETFPDAEYVIYTFIYNHLERQFRVLLDFFSTRITPMYKIKNGELILKNNKYDFLYSLFSVKKFYEKESQNKYEEEIRNNLPLFMKTMEESVKKMKEQYPDSKFVFIEFPEAWMCDKEYIEGSSELKKEDIKKLESLGIIYINAEELAGHKFRDIEKYRVADRDHPNETVWEELAPLLAKKLKL